MPKRCIFQFTLLAGCIVLSTALGQREDNEFGFIEKFQRIKDHTENELSSIYKEAEKKYNPKKSRSEQKKLFDDIGTRSQDVLNAATKKALEIVEPHSANDDAAEPLAWIATKSINFEEGRAAVNLLLEHHLVHESTLALGKSLGRAGNPLGEKILRMQLRSPELPNEYQWKVKLSLARLLLAKTDLIERCSNATNEDLAQLVKSLGEERVAGLDRASFEMAEAEAISLFDDLRQEYPDQEVIPGVKVSDFADSSVFAMKNLRIGMAAPNIEGKTWMELRLSSGTIAEAWSCSVSGQLGAVLAWQRFHTK